MTIRTLLVSASQDPGRDNRVNLACDLAKAFGARIVGTASAAVGAVPNDSFFVGAMTGELATLYLEMAETEVRDSRAGFDAAIAACGLEARWVGAIGYPASVMNAAARSADLLVVAAHSPGVPRRAPDPVAVIAGAGRPVLVVPESPKVPLIGHPAVVAWKDSRESRLAVAASLPLLKAAPRTCLLSVCRDEEAGETADSLAEVQAWLETHGVTASSEVLVRNETPTGRRLLARANGLGAGLIVSGAYGHMRLAEWVLGGVTHSLLKDSPVCLLMAR